MQALTTDLGLKDTLLYYLLLAKGQATVKTAISLPPQFLWQPFRGYACLLPSRQPVQG